MSKITCKTAAVLLVCALAVSAAAYQHPSPKTPAGAKKPEKQVNACSLLTTSEVETVQADHVEEAKPSTEPAGAMKVFQCLYRTTTPSKSVSLGLVAREHESSSDLTPRKFWKRQFHGAGEEGDKDAPKRDAKESREEESDKPRRIAGVGEEAYWVSNPVAGILYVLQGDKFLRISVGGVKEEPARIEKSKILARAALKRL